MDWCVLMKIAELFKNDGIRWALGGSLVLSHYGLGVPPNDIDLMVAEEDAVRADRLLDTLGEKQQRQESALYATRHFSEYRIGTTEVDVMAGLRINHAAGCYHYLLQPEAVTEGIWADGSRLPMTALEDWFVLYQLIPGRAHKADMIEAFLNTHNSIRTDLLEQASGGCLPDEVRQRIHRLMAERNPKACPKA